jgi:hypothetical protein
MSKSLEQLLGAYIVLPEGNLAQETRIWKAVTDSWKFLGDAYLACVNQARDSKSVPGTFRPHLPVLAARTTRALRYQIKWVLMRYGVVPAGIWEELARCTQLAETAGVIDKMVELYPGTGQQSSPSYELLRAIMLWMASPTGLSPIEQNIAERLVIHLTPKFRVGIKPWEGCTYCFDLDGARPPIRLMRSTPVTATTRYFDVSDARQSVRAMHALVSSSGNIPSAVDLGPGADGATAARVLKHLGINWAKELPARAAERRKTAMSLRVVHGLQNVQDVIELGRDEGIGFSAIQQHDSLIAEDASPGGYGVIVPAGKGEWLRVGVLVALRSDTDAVWNLGLIRRVKSDENRQHHIAIQLISRAAVPVYLRSLTGVEHGSKPQSAILLSPRLSPNGSLHIVARRDLLSGREPIEATYGKPVSTVIIDPGGVVESGHDFDWLRYKLSKPIA